MDNVLFAVFEFMQPTEQQVMGSHDAYVDNPEVVNYRILS